MIKSKAPFPCVRLFHPIMIAMVCGCHRNKPPLPSPPPVLSGIRHLMTDLDRTALVSDLVSGGFTCFDTQPVRFHSTGTDVDVELLDGSTSSGVFV